MNKAQSNLVAKFQRTQRLARRSAAYLLNTEMDGSEFRTVKVLERMGLVKFDTVTEEGETFQAWVLVQPEAK